MDKEFEIIFHVQMEINYKIIRPLFMLRRKMRSIRKDGWRLSTLLTIWRRVEGDKTNKSNSASDSPSMPLCRREIANSIH